MKSEPLAITSNKDSKSVDSEICEVRDRDGVRHGDHSEMKGSSEIYSLFLHLMFLVLLFM